MYESWCHPDQRKCKTRANGRNPAIQGIGGDKAATNFRNSGKSAQQGQ